MSQEATFKSIVCEIFGIQEGDVADTKTPEDIESWTSVTHMQLVARFEESFKFQFDVEEITEMDSIASMKNVLRKHGVDL
ncbi:MAG: acyl carrier protein [Candidatus Lokiarchaeota archaeon]|nr:acyl carrier protein [Candidatus Lokiarchaeota archaeon]